MHRQTGVSQAAQPRDGRRLAFDMGSDISLTLAPDKNPQPIPCLRLRSAYRPKAHRGARS